MSELYQNIMGEPEVLTDVLNNRKKYFGALAEKYKDAERIYVVGSGTSFHCGLSVRRFMEQLTGLEVTAAYPSVFMEGTVLHAGKALCVGISQSGRSAVTVKALERCRKAGYYTAAVSRKLPTARLLGLDLSPEAVRALAGRDEARAGRIFPLVAGVYRLPLADGSVDGVISAFSPYAGEEFRRVLRRGGYLFRAIPDRRHLFALKEVLYDLPYENEVADFEEKGFAFCGAKEIKTVFTLKTPSEIADLLGMTPYAYRTPPAGKERLSKLTELTVGAEFLLLTYRRE